MTKDEATVKRFQREVKAAAKLSHPNIVHANDASVQRGVWYLVMEYVEGRDLSPSSKSVGRCPSPKPSIASCKPLVVSPMPTVKAWCIVTSNQLTCCSTMRGSSKFSTLAWPVSILRRCRRSSTDDTGAVMGTVDYMSMTGARAHTPTRRDAASDIYSLGCSLYRHLTVEISTRSYGRREDSGPHESYDSDAGQDSTRRACRDRPLFQKMVAKKPRIGISKRRNSSPTSKPGNRRVRGGASSSLPSDPQLSHFLKSINQPKGTATSTVQTAVKTEQTMTYAVPEVRPTQERDRTFAACAAAKQATKPKPRVSAGQAAAVEEHQVLIGPVPPGSCYCCLA